MLDLPSAEDRAGLIRLLTDPQVREFLGGVRSVERAVEIADGILARTGRKWSVRNAETGEFMGLLTLDEHHDGEDIEVSYLFLPEFQRQGLAFESLTLLLASPLGLTRVVAETQVRNAPSCRLLERLGFVRKREVVRFGEKQVIYARDLAFG